MRGKYLQRQTYFRQCVTSLFCTKLCIRNFCTNTSGPVLISRRAILEFLGRHTDLSLLFAWVNYCICSLWAHSDTGKAILLPVVHFYYNLLALISMKTGSASHRAKRKYHTLSRREEVEVDFHLIFLSPLVSSMYWFTVYFKSRMMWLAIDLNIF